MIIFLINNDTWTIEDTLINMKAKQDIVIEDRDDAEWVYLYTYYIAEENVAQKLITLNNYKNVKKISRFEKELQLFE